jgi:hypothetical protein
MPEIIAGLLISFFAVVGIAETGRSIKHYFFSPKHGTAAFVFSCKGHEEQIEYYLRSLANQASELGLSGEPLIIVIDRGMDDETRSICERLTYEINGLEVCKTGELPLLFGGELQN